MAEHAQDAVELVLVDGAGVVPVEIFKCVAHLFKLLAGDA